MHRIGGKGGRGGRKGSNTKGNTKKRRHQEMTEWVRAIRIGKYVVAAQVIQGIISLSGKA